MPKRNSLYTARIQIALANRELAKEGVFDAFGHISMRHPGDPNRYLMSRWRLPALIMPDDILEFSLDSEPVEHLETELDPERVIDGCIYQARADVMAVCHHHASAILPFCIAGVPIPQRVQTDFVSEYLPIWNQRDEFGDTDLRLVKPKEARSLAIALGQHTAVLMRHHGATVVGGDLDEVVRRSIWMCKNAETHMRAQLGTL
jgi:ribulose-5-phosphate 4-epimerase/fuculose-1-phosphate aldolase